MLAFNLRKTTTILLCSLVILVLPILIAFEFISLWDWDFSVPLIYLTGGDEIWQYVLTKMLLDTGWILNNPYLGAPDIAHWYGNPAGQMSSLHSILMRALSIWIDDPIRVQQTYYLLNFSLICLTTFLACRLIDISLIPSLCIGLLFSFCSFRFNWIYYSFLANYFAIPLAVVPSVWFLQGKFSSVIPASSLSSWRRSVVSILKCKEFWLSVIFVVLVTLSDGYYSFFTLLLLCFSILIRLLVGDFRQPWKLIPGVCLVAILISTSWALMIPLKEFERSHHDEFYVNGKLDPALNKHSFEAEVYSSSLKMMTAPIPNHRISMLADLGKRIAETSDAAKRFQANLGAASLGTLGTLLLCAAFALLVTPPLRRRLEVIGSPHEFGKMSVLDALLALTLFSFLASIFGGVGTLIALIFPTIRAYDRFVLFLLIILYFGAGWIITQHQDFGKRPTKSVLLGLAITAVTILALFDNIPINVAAKRAITGDQFLAERRFVAEIERSLPTGSMVYQFPYSQFLQDNTYYGWGSHNHIRLYLHSHALRWSNGGAKNSPGDNWHLGLSQLPPEQLLVEVEAAGFAGAVIDRSVVKDPEFEIISQFLSSRGYSLVKDDAAKLAFVALRNPGYQVTYDPSFSAIDQIEVSDPALLLSQDVFPALLDPSLLREIVKKYVTDKASLPFVIRRTEHPSLFLDGSLINRGTGRAAISNLGEMSGRLSCEMDPSNVMLKLKNLSEFDWLLGTGQFPIGIGVHIKTVGGKLIDWDTGFRVPAELRIGQGEEKTISFPISSLHSMVDAVPREPYVVEFAVVQEGNAWFNQLSCSMALR